MDKATLAKLPEKLKIRKVEGITRRWLFSILGVIAVLFIVTFVVASAGIKDYYYNRGYCKIGCL